MNPWFFFVKWILMWAWGDASSCIKSSLGNPAITFQQILSSFYCSCYAQNWLQWVITNSFPCIPSHLPIGGVAFPLLLKILVHQWKLVGLTIWCPPSFSKNIKLDHQILHQKNYIFYNISCENKTSIFLPSFGSISFTPRVPTRDIMAIWY